MAVPKERVEAIFKEISGYKIELAADPTVLGAKYLQDQIATCRNYTNHVARIINELHKEKMGIDFDLKRKETAFKIASDELLAKNPHVRGLPNITDRQAQINILLRDEHREIEGLKNDIRELEHLEKMVRMVHRELKDTMGEIKLQRSLIRDEIDTGRMYGDERPSAREASFMANGSRADDIDDEEIDRILRGETPLTEMSNGTEIASGSTTQTADAPVQTTSEVAPQTEIVDVIESVEVNTETTPPAKPLTEEEQVIAFLDKKEEPVRVVSPGISEVTQKVTSDDDFRDIFDSM